MDRKILREEAYSERTPPPIDWDKEQAAADQDLCNRLGLTPERLKEIRGK